MHLGDKLCKAILLTQDTKGKLPRQRDIPTRSWEYISEKNINVEIKIPSKIICISVMAPQMKYHKIQSLNFATLDVFTSTQYEGNPLAVVRIPAVLRSAITQQQKQIMANEFNLSETVFLHEQKDPNIPEWDIDIFTTNDELPFAGRESLSSGE